MSGWLKGARILYKTITHNPPPPFPSLKLNVFIKVHHLQLQEKGYYIFHNVGKSEFVFHHSGLSWSRQHTFSQTYRGKTRNKKGEFIHFMRPNQGVDVLNSHFLFHFIILVYSLIFPLPPFALIDEGKELKGKLHFPWTLS